MSNLTGQAIQNTYPGLLNLATATTGITSTPQQIQDGLGNNSNTRISTSGIISPNIVNMNNLKPDYCGNGFSTAASVANSVNTQNKVLFVPFYDTGNFSFSAVSYNLDTLSTTSDVVTLAFYTMQYVPLIGIAPKDLIMSGITLESASPSTTGIKTTNLPSTLSFSGTGGGYYIAAYYVSNSGTTPTVRFKSPNITSFVSNGYAWNLGFVLNASANGTQIGIRAGTIGTQSSSLNLPFQLSYSQSDITSNSSVTIVNTTWGFGLKTI